MTNHYMANIARTPIARRDRQKSFSGERLLTHRRCSHAVVQRDIHKTKRKIAMNQIIWIVGAVVIVLFILGFLGMR